MHQFPLLGLGLRLVFLHLMRFMIYQDDDHSVLPIDFLRPIKTAEMFEAVDWLGDLPQQTWPKATRPVELRHFDVILLKSTAAILAAATFVGDRTTASTSLAGADAMVLPTTSWYHQSNWQQSVAERLWLQLHVDAANSLSNFRRLSKCLIPAIISWRCLYWHYRSVVLAVAASPRPL